MKKRCLTQHRATQALAGLATLKLSDCLAQWACPFGVTSVRVVFHRALALMSLAAAATIDGRLRDPFASEDSIESGGADAANACACRKLYISTVC